jgi:hypothetical protein
MVKTKKYGKRSKRSKRSKHSKQKHKSQKGGVGSKTTSRLDNKVNDVAVILAQLLTRTSIKATNRNLVERGVVSQILKDIPRDTIRTAILHAKKKELENSKSLLRAATEEKDKKALQYRIRDLDAEFIQLTRDEQLLKSIKRALAIPKPKIR